jgi:hypothetical protein
MEDISVLRLGFAARIAALCDALRDIPEELAPCARARVVAVREQVYYGWELPLSRARGDKLLFGKYELDGWWSVAAANLVLEGKAVRGRRQLEREHVNPAADWVNELLATRRLPEAVAALLDECLVTCTVLAAEHRLLRRGAGWQRYGDAGIKIRLGITTLGI